MERVLAHTAANLSVTFYSDETAVDPDGQTATVTITKDSDGTALVTGAATTRLGVGVYQYSTPVLASPDILTLVWSGTFSGQAQTIETHAEVVGGRIVALAEARARDSVLILPKYTTAMLEDYRLETEDEFEEVCKRSFIERYGKTISTSHVRDQFEIVLDHNDVSEILSIEVDGDAIATDNWHVELGRFLVFDDTSLTPGTEIVVKYVYGLARVPSDVVSAGVRRMRSKATESASGIPDRATSFQPTEGGTYSLAVPGRSGWITAIPEIDVVLHRWSLRTPGTG